MLRRYALPAFVLLLLGLIYLSTLQTIPNGSDHYFMIDVGEDQNVLNLWGTMHATGYPVYVMTGALLVTLMKALGIAAVTAPALVSLCWGLLALGLMYVLGLRLTRQPLAAACCVLLFGLTRTVWIHHSIAEIYTFGLLILLLLYAVALWPVKHRILWLALDRGLCAGAAPRLPHRDPCADLRRLAGPAR